MMTLEEIKKTLEKDDERTREERAVKIHRLESLTLFGNKHDIPSMDMLKESQSSYVNGNYRSCIFACASLLDGILTHEMIINSEDKEKTYSEITSGYCTLGVKIGMVKEISKRQSIMDDAKFLLRIRNIIAVHPPYTHNILPDDTKVEVIWKNKTVIRTVKDALPLLDECFKKQFLGTPLWIIEGETKGGKLGDVLGDSTNSDIHIYRDFFQDFILERLALKSYKTIKKILETLYPS